MTPEDFLVEDLDRGVLIRCPNEGCSWWQSFQNVTPILWNLSEEARRHILERHT